MVVETVAAAASVGQMVMPFVKDGVVINEQRKWGEAGRQAVRDITHDAGCAIKETGHAIRSAGEKMGETIDKRTQEITQGTLVIFNGLAARAFSHIKTCSNYLFLGTVSTFAYGVQVYLIEPARVETCIKNSQGFDCSLASASSRLMMIAGTAGLVGMVCKVALFTFNKGNGSSIHDASQYDYVAELDSQIKLLKTIKSK